MSSPMTAAKGRQNYQSAMQRKRCGTCAHAVECYAGTWQCRKGSFLVTVYAVCDDWVKRPAPSFKAGPTR